MSMLFCSWAKKDEEADDDQDVDDEDQKSDSKEAEKEEIEENTEAVSDKEEPSEDCKEDEASCSKTPAEAAPAFFCKWATEEEYKSDSEQDSESETGEHREDKSEAVEENDTVEPEEEKVEEPPPPEPVKEDKPVIFCKWGDHAEYESSEEEEEEEDKRLEEDAKLEPESEEEDKILDNVPAAEESGGWMVRMVEDATNDLLNLPLAPESNSDAQDPFDSVFSSSRAGGSSRTGQRKASRTTNNYGSDSDAGDNYIPDVDTSNFEVIDDWDDYVADTIEGNEKEEREAATKRTTRNKAGRKPGPKSMKPGPKSMKPGPKSKSSPKSHNIGPKSARPGPASRRSRRRSSSEGSGENLDLSSIRLNKRNDVGVTAAERKLANKHMVVDKEEDEEEDVPLARRRKSGGSRKRKGEGEERTRTKKARTDTTGENRRSSRDSEVGWPRLSSVFDSGEDGRRVRKPTAKVQPFVHLEPEKEKRRVRPKDRSRSGGVAGTKKRVHQPAKGPYFTACKIGSYRCPLCFTRWQLNQPYGRHIIAQACQVDPPDPVARGGDDEDDDDRPIRWVSVTPATAKRDSSVKLGKVPSLKKLSRSALDSCPSLPTVKEGLEYYHSLYSPYNRTIQARLFANIRVGAKLNLVAGLAGYEKLCREPLKIAIYLERKISLARTKLGSRHTRTKGWVAKYTTLLKLPLHDLFLVAASPYRVLEYPVEDTITEMVGLMCLTCPKMACTGCPKVVKVPVKVEKKSNSHPAKKSEPKITLKIKKELIEKKHKKEKKEKKKEKKEKKKEKVVIPSGLVMTCSSCSTVFNSVTGLGEHRRLCKGK